MITGAVPDSITHYYYLVTFTSQLGGPFGFCAFALLSELLPGSLKIALKRTRPRQRFWYVGRYSMTEGGGCQGRVSNKEKSLILRKNDSRLKTILFKKIKQAIPIN